MWLAHHGILGQKWGIRRFQNKDGSRTAAGKKHKWAETENGSKKTNKLAEKAANSAPGKTAYKNFKKFEKQSYKEEELAYKKGDLTSAKSIAAGRTYLRTLMDPSYQEAAITSAAVAANVPIGKNFTYSFSRNNDRGGVDVTVNGITTNLTDAKRVYDKPVSNEQINKTNSALSNKKEKVSNKSDAEEKKLVKDMLKNYDKNDPDADEAMEILREIERSNRR